MILKLSLRNFWQRTQWSLPCPFIGIPFLLQWNMVGEVLVSGVLNAGDIAKTDGCQQAAALAEKF